MAERGYRNLNTSVIRQISKALEHDPTANIEPVLHKLCASYASLRQKVTAHQVKQQTVDKEEKRSPSEPPAKKPRLALPGVLLPLAEDLQLQRPTFVSCPSEHYPLPPSIPCSLPYSIIHPLSPAVREILGVTDESLINLSSSVVRCVLSGTTICESPSRAVIRVGEDVVVKVAQRFDHDEHGVLQFLDERVPGIAAPRALGLVEVGSTSFMFMTRIPGTTLETRWASLSPEAKKHVQRALDKNFAALRELELPPGAPLGFPLGRRICKDVRRDERVSTSPIHNEAQFNDFLLHSPSSRAAQGHKSWLRSMLRTDHRILFTHADLHPRNVMVVDRPDGGVELSGLIDWEASGYYPEYWEHVKATNTRSIKDTSDWWDHLPPSIVGYDHDIVLDHVIESTVVY
ncbi:kinase-like protein [Pisolithus croceorrhizus]|nr:kinase-like protein [Pisolithus croceorrhizus]